MSTVAQETLLENPTNYQAFSIQEVKEFFDAYDLGSPPLPENIPFYQVDTYLFGSSPFTEILLNEPSLEEAIQDPDSFEYYFPHLLMGYTGYGFNSWYFRYKLTTEHLEINIRTLLDSSLDFPTEENEVVEENEPANSFITLCYTLINLCLYLEKSGNFFQEDSHDKLFLFINNMDINFASLDKNQNICAKGDTADTFFNLVERKLDSLDEQAVHPLAWMRI